MSTLTTSICLDEWHTLTYLTLTPIRQNEQTRFLLSTVTENGYFFTWLLDKESDKVQHQLLYSRKIHNGSIEALSFREVTDRGPNNQNIVAVGACCASDLSWNLIKFKSNEQASDNALAKI